MNEVTAARKAAVLGSPVAHSRSPQLHLAAYRALGLDDWTYDRIECTADELPALVAGFGPEWVGVSVTMPGKFAALRFADERSARAELIGSANTLVRTEHGWRADNTDVDGVAGALGDVRNLRRAVVLGSGGTAPAAIVAPGGLGVTITVVARNPEKAARLLDLASKVGVAATYVELGSPDLAAVVDRADVLVSTVPADVAGRYATTFAPGPGVAGRHLRPVAHTAGRRRRGAAGRSSAACRCCCIRPSARSNNSQAAGAARTDGGALG